MSETSMTSSHAAVDMGVWQMSRQQEAFRQLMNAFSYPGRVLALARPNESALMLVLATLADNACSVADPLNLLGADDLRRLGARSAGVESADFVLAGGACVPQEQPRIGLLESPEQGATIVVCVAGLGSGATLHLQGPGIDGERLLHVAGVDPQWWTRRAEWNSHFPMGVDLILVSGDVITALPRTTHITVKGTH